MAKAKSKYPRTMYKVTPSLNVQEIVLVGPATSRGFGGGSFTISGYAADAKGRHHYLSQLFGSRDDAVRHAQRTLEVQEERYAKAGENLAKRRANVEKLEG